MFENRGTVAERWSAMQYSLMTMFGLEYARKSDQDTLQVVSIFKLASMAYLSRFMSIQRR